MKPNSDITLTDMGPLYEQALPVLSDRVFVFSLLLDSIAHCEDQGSSAWSLTQLADGFRLNVGQVEAMTCRFSFWLAGESDLDRDATLVSVRHLLVGADCVNKIDLSQPGANIDEMSYRSVGVRHWCFEGQFYAGINEVEEPSRALVEANTAALLENHQAFLELACQTPSGNLRQRSNFARFHCEALREYAVEVVRGDTLASVASGAMGERGQGIPPLMRVRIEKVAADAGYERSVTWSGNTATLSSVQFPESVRVQYLGAEEFLVAASNPAVVPQVGSPGSAQVFGWTALYEVLEKVSATARTLPDRLAQQYIRNTATLPQSTEAERWVVQRVGQDLFRAALLDYWRGRCCVTGLNVPGLLRASHMRPWSRCDTDEQRLDVFNGLLLAPQLDALFDGGWMTFSDNGAVLLSPSLGRDACEAIGFSESWALDGLLPAHADYLAYHRSNVWLSA